MAMFGDDSVGEVIGYDGQLNRRLRDHVKERDGLDQPTPFLEFTSALVSNTKIFARFTGDKASGARVSRGVDRYGASGGPVIQYRGDEPLVTGGLSGGDGGVSQYISVLNARKLRLAESYVQQRKN